MSRSGVCAGVNVLRWEIGGGVDDGRGETLQLGTGLREKVHFFLPSNDHTLPKLVNSCVREGGFDTTSRSEGSIVN